jgi:hypothetical protein
VTSNATHPLLLSPGGRRYGVLASPVDARDLQYAALYPVSARWSFWAWLKGLFHPAPPVAAKYITQAKVDLRPWAGPVKSQGSLGACSGFAYSGLMELLCRKYPGHLPADTRDRFEPTKVILSPLFTYWWNRRNDGKLEVQAGKSAPGTELKYVGIDRGATMRAGMRTLRWQGVCLEKEHPYAPSNFKQKPEVSDCDEAMYFRGGQYCRLSTVEEMKNCLRAGYPIAMGIEVYESFESPQVARTGQVPVPNPEQEQLHGGHAVLCVGFDDKTEHFIVRNSWGSDWGCGGDFFLPYAFFPHITDMWTMHLPGAPRA